MNWTGKWLIVVICLFFLVGCNGNDKTIEVIDENSLTYQVIGENPKILVHDLEGGMEMEVLRYQKAG